MAQRTPENTARVIAVAAAFFGGLAALAYANGVFTRLGAELSALLLGFAVAYGWLTWHLDPGLRAFAKRLVAPRATVRKPASERAATI